MNLSKKNTGREQLKVNREDRNYLKTLFIANGPKFTLWLAFHFGIWLLLAVLIMLIDNVVIQVFFSLLLGNQLHAITILQHDCGHRSAYKSKQANLWVGRFLAWFIIMPFTAFTEPHKRHHNSYGNRAKDPDDWFYGAGPLMLFIREWSFVPRFIYISLVRYGGKVRNTVIAELVFNLVTWVLVVVATYQFDRVLELYLILFVPLGLLAFVINPISRGYEHYPLSLMEESDDNRSNIGLTTVTVTSPLLSFLWANITYHVEHHMYPAAPFYNLPEIHRLMKHRDYIRAPYPLYKYPLGIEDGLLKQLNS